MEIYNNSMPQPPRRPFSPRKGPGDRTPTKSNSDGGWDAVAEWYDKLVGEKGSDYHKNVILPAALKMLDARPGESVIDVCCGQGVLAKPMLDAKVAKFVGVDASRRLIESARARHGSDPRVSFIIADACASGSWADGTHDAATCIMAVHDVPDIKPLFSNIAKSLKPGGRAVFVFMHPCFRIPKKSHWGWDADQKIQFRRLDSYATPLEIEIATHPGKGTADSTSFRHRPLADVLTALGGAGLGVTAGDELCSHRRSQGTGPFSKAEHRAAEEFPLFLALAARKYAG